MGCISSKGARTREAEDHTADFGYSAEQYSQAQGQTNWGGRGVEYRKPTWKSEEVMTEQKISQMRAQFWDTSPHYGGAREIWDALKAACEMEDLETTKLILESAGVIVAAPDMTICYDERGAKYDLPLFVISDPVNLAR